jgi:hypothetical protein
MKRVIDGDTIQLESGELRPSSRKKCRRIHRGHEQIGTLPC